MPNRIVRTVLGDIDPQTLGRTMMHEHLLIGFGRWRREQQEAESAPRADQRQFDPISLTNRYEVAYYGRHPGQYLLDDEEIALEEARLYHAAGGQTLVDVTNPDLTRNPDALERIARATGLNVVMGCGTYVNSMHHPDMAERSVDGLAQEMIDDILVGADGTGVKSGIIGEIGTEYPIEANEEKSLRAAALAQQATGVAISIHPGRDIAAPLAVMAILTDAGANPERVVMGHLDRTLFTVDQMTELAETGCYLEFDLFGQESSYYAHAPIDMPNDAMRIAYIMALIAKGHDRIVVSQDICQKTNTVHFGGHGYGHILERVVPMMKRKGMADGEIDRILIDNPREILAF